MTEPSKEAIEIADNQPLAEVLRRGLAREIDALTEQRVAAAVERIRQKTPDRARILVNAIIAEAAGRPAPEGAAPTKDERHWLCPKCWRPWHQCLCATDLARPRCSAPSQEDTQPGCGTGVPFLDSAIARLMQTDQASVMALGDIAVERVRQIEAAGWTLDHDDAHAQGQLATAGAAYALAWHTPKGSTTPPPAFWPWHLDWWKPRSKHRNCVRAGALLVAELARHLRSATPPTDAGGPGSASNAEAAQGIPSDYAAALASPVAAPGDHPPGFEAARKDWNSQLAGRDMSVADWNSLTFGEQQGYAAESSPTQAVAPPGPTAGDVVSRAMRDAEFRGEPHRIAAPGASVAAIDISVANLLAVLENVYRAARAELLAQIREPTLHRAVAQFVAENLGYDPKLNWKGTISDEDFPQVVENICDALADKLTEAK